MAPVITVENLGKKYTISHQQRGDDSSLREAITNGAASFARKLLSPFTIHPSPVSASQEDFWALNDVSFEVRQGERIGIIGRNGAGKSTLLKILSRITEPTTGRVRIRGRVASLLEVGTGFHPELTGRENIYLNGAILGMSRQEINRKFDEIVAFAEVEKFLDTPVKRYSSGMYVRLAFAVAAHLEPEILIVDEVLAVGDAQFQKKCLGKMEEVGREGRTVLFVSHNMNAVERLCSSALQLDSGQVAGYGCEVRKIIEQYLSTNSGYRESAWTNPGSYYANDYFMPLRFAVTDENGQQLGMPVKNDTDVWVHIEGVSSMPDPALTVGYAIYSDNETLLYWSYQTDIVVGEQTAVKYGINILRSKLPKRFLNEGNYRIELISSLHFRQWITEPCKNAPYIMLTIQGGLSDSPYFIQKRPGLLAPVIPWQLERRLP